MHLIKPHNYYRSYLVKQFVVRCNCKTSSGWLAPTMHVCFYEYLHGLATTVACCFVEEFVAHGSNVNCLALGHKSGRVMVTGGEDKKVNMWAVGKPNCIMVSGRHHFLPPI